MNKELEALLMTAAKAVGMGVVGCDEKRAEDWGVPVARFARKGELLPGYAAPCESSGYYIPSGGESLGIESNNPGDGWTRYSLFVYGPATTGVRHFQGCSGVYRLSEMKTLLRGIYYGASAVRGER